jgi:hypothetical protein
VLSAEIMGHYRSYQALASITGGGDHATGSTVQRLQGELQQEGERIFRLLKMLHPAHDMHSAYVGLQSEDPIVHDNAVEFLEAVLSPHLRAQVIPLFDRNVSIRDRAELAARIVGTATAPVSST